MLQKAFFLSTLCLEGEWVSGFGLIGLSKLGNRLGSSPSDNKHAIV